MKTRPSQSATRAPAGSKSPKCPLKHLRSLKMSDKEMRIVPFLLACHLCLSWVPFSLLPPGDTDGKATTEMKMEGGKERKSEGRQNFKPLISASFPQVNKTSSCGFSEGWAGLDFRALMKDLKIILWALVEDSPWMWIMQAGVIHWSQR